MSNYFDSPSADSIGEKLLLARGGALAVWSSSGMTTPDGQDIMNKAFYSKVVKDGEKRIGIATLSAEATLISTGEYSDHLKTWTLLGDPATQLK